MKVDKYVFIISILCLLILSPFFLKPDILTTKDNDLGRTYIPLFSFMKDSFKDNHQIPLWRPSQMMGETFVGNPISSLVYPLNIIFFIFPINSAAVTYQFLHFLISVVSVYLLARTFKLSNLSSFSAAIFYTFSIKFLFHLTAGHITMLAAYSFFPLVFFSLRQFFLKKEFKYFLLGSTALSFIYITYPTIFFYTVLFMIAYTTYFLISLKFIKKDFPFFESGKVIFKTLSIIFIALLLSSAALIPNLEFGPFSTRSILRIEDIAIPLWNLKRFLMSLSFPYPILDELDQESILFVGIVPIALALIGYLSLKRIQKLIFTLFLITIMLYIAGTSTPFFKFVYDFVPFLNYSRVTTRPFFIVILVISLLSAKALEKIKNKKLIYLLITIFLFESIYIFTLKLLSIPNLNFKNRDIYEFLSRDESLFRVYCTTYCFNPQLIEKYAIQTLAGETPIQDANFINFLQKAGGYQYNNFAVIFPPYQVWQTGNPPPPDPVLLGNANVKYVVSTYELLSPDFSYIDKFDNLILYQNKKFKARVFFKNAEEIESTYYSPNSIYAKFSPKPYERELIFSENYYPGWKAYVNKNEESIQKEKGIFRKVIVPAFKEEAELKYKPESFTLGRTLSLGTLLFMLLFIFRKHEQKN